MPSQLPDSPARLPDAVGVQSSKLDLSPINEGSPSFRLPMRSAFRVRSKSMASRACQLKNKEVVVYAVVWMHYLPFSVVSKCGTHSFTSTPFLLMTGVSNQCHTTCSGSACKRK
eukprot:UN22511